jgi:outer membrane receptor protein involved in Fe transport
VRNEIFSVSPTGTVGVFFQNVGATRREGVEIGLRARARHVVEAYLNYAYTRATFQEQVELTTPLPPGAQTASAGRSFALVPEHRLNAGLAWHPYPWATVSLGILYVSPQFLRGDEANHQAPLRAYWVVNAGLSVRRGGFEGFVKINNLLDKRYETFGTFAPDGRLPGAPVVRFLTPAPPINILAGLRYAF